MIQRIVFQYKDTWHIKDLTGLGAGDSEPTLFIRVGYCFVFFDTGAKSILLKRYQCLNFPHSDSVLVHTGYIGTGAILVPGFRTQPCCSLHSTFQRIASQY